MYSMLLPRRPWYSWRGRKWDGGCWFISFIAQACPILLWGISRESCIKLATAVVPWKEVCSSFPLCYYSDGGLRIFGRSIALTQHFHFLHISGAFIMICSTKGWLWPTTLPIGQGSSRWMLTWKNSVPVLHAYIFLRYMSLRAKRPGLHC